MIRLYGTPLSNYYNMVKLALLEKGLAFEEVEILPNQTPDYLARSPMGKIPCLELAEGFLSESAAIMEFLEDRYPDRPLYPGDDFGRARARQIMHIAEKYIEAPAHRVLESGYKGDPLPENQLSAIRETLGRSLGAVGRLATFSPYLMGQLFTCADIVTYYAAQVVDQIAGEICGGDIYGPVPGFARWRERVADRPCTQRVDEEKRLAWASFKEAESR